jgi:hypothetical protein
MEPDRPATVVPFGIDQLDGDPDMDKMMTVLSILGVVLLLVIPIIRFLRTNFYPRSVVFIDHDGEKIVEISPERVQQTDVKELERMYERVRHEKHVRIRAVA